MSEFLFPNKSWKREVAGTRTGLGFLGYHYHRCEMLVGIILCNFFEISVLDLKNRVHFSSLNPPHHRMLEQRCGITTVGVTALQ